MTANELVINKSLEILCKALAQQIEIAGREAGVPYAAGQSEYGVSWEYLVEGKWIRERDVHWSYNGAEIEAVRFFDCDGERSDEATSVVEILDVAKAWINMNMAYQPDA